MPQKNVRCYVWMIDKKKLRNFDIRAFSLGQQNDICKVKCIKNKFKKKLMAWSAMNKLIYQQI